VNLFDAPETDGRMGFDLHLLVVSAMLGAWALAFGLLALTTGGGGLLIGALQPPMGGPDEPSPTAVMFMGLFEGGLFTAFALPAALAAFGVLARRPWGLWLALVCCALWAGSCCFPFAIYAFWALLRPDGRARFGY
jgi:hypothetical protein